MSPTNPVPGLAVDYDKAAQEYLRSLPLEHFMESISQGTQREITLESLALVRAHRPDVQVFNELLVQYLHHGRLRQVVPDNMVVVNDQPVRAEGSFNLEMEPVPPLWVLEYVSPTNRRKDYVDSFRKYERELRVPYYLLFYPDRQDLRLYHQTAGKYVQVEANDRGRLTLPELNLELGLLGGWVRYWLAGVLLELPGELQDRLEETQLRLKKAEKQVQQAEKQVQQAEKQVQQAEKRAQRQQQRAEQEKQQRAAAETEVARLRALLAQFQKDNPEWDSSGEEK